MTKREYDCLKRMRRKLTHENWEQIKTAYATGIGLREIARKMNIPEGTVLAHAKRHGWTQQIQVASQELSVMQSDAITPMQSLRPVPQSIAAILSERKDRTKLGLSKYAAEAAEQAAGHPDKLGIAGKVKDVASVHSTLWPEDPNERGILNVGILTGQVNIVRASDGFISSGPDKGKYQNLETGEIITEPRTRLNERVPDAQTGEVVKDQEEEEKQRATQSGSLPTPDATNATNAAIARPANAPVTAEDPSRLAYRERCMYWRRDGRPS